MANLMKHAPATQYFLLDRPGNAALMAPPPEPRAAPALVRRTSSVNNTVRLPASSYSAASTNTEEQLVQYLRETYGQPRPSSEELRNLGHMPFLSAHW